MFLVKSLSFFFGGGGGGGRMEIFSLFSFLPDLLVIRGQSLMSQTLIRKHLVCWQKADDTGCLLNILTRRKVEQISGTGGTTVVCFFL